MRKDRAEDGANPFDPPETAPLMPASLVSEGRLERRFSYDPVRERALYVTDADGGVFGEGVRRFDEIGTTQNHALKRELQIGPDDPLTARYDLTESYFLQRPAKDGEDWDIRIEIRCGMTSTRDTFVIWGELEAFEAGKSFLRREWREEIPRDLL
jgi:hypothetical protein